MKTIGLIGGMSWESSAEYYRLINEEVKRRLGGLHSARSLMLSIDFAEIEELQRARAWEQASRQLIDAGRRLERGGADFVLLSTDTMHRVADELERTLVHDVIYDELALGRVEAPSRAAFAEVIGGLVGEGAEGIVLGCTEIGLLVGEADAPVPLFDTTRIHAERAVELALQ